MRSTENEFYSLEEDCQSIERSFRMPRMDYLASPTKWIRSMIDSEMRRYLNQLSTRILLSTGIMVSIVLIASSHVPTTWYDIVDNIAKGVNGSRCVLTDKYANIDSSYLKHVSEILAILVCILLIIVVIENSCGILFVRYSFRIRLMSGFASLIMALMCSIMTTMYFLIRTKMEAHLGRDFCLVGQSYHCKLIVHLQTDQKCWSMLWALLLSMVSAISFSVDSFLNLF
ncbi:hypothetical protein ACOME3_004026 [Neoechinorhynchus agilis]